MSPLEALTKQLRDHSLLAEQSKVEESERSNKYDSRYHEVPLDSKEEASAFDIQEDVSVEKLVATTTLAPCEDCIPSNIPGKKKIKNDVLIFFKNEIKGNYFFKRFCLLCQLFLQLPPQLPMSIM